MTTEDTDWTEPGETAGKPDRYQSRHLHGCFLSAGSNGRHADGRYIGGDAAPWRCSLGFLTRDQAEAARRAVPCATFNDNPVMPDRHVVIVVGSVSSQGEAIKRAESAALAMYRAVANLRRS